MKGPKVIIILIVLIIGIVSIQLAMNKDDSPEKMRKGPYLIYAGNSTSMTVLWQTSCTPTSSTIEWGSTESYGSGKNIVSEKNNKDHQFYYTITNLTPNSRIYYEVTVDGKRYNGSFKTAPADSAKSLTFYVCSDTRSNPDIYDDIISQLMTDIKIKPDDRQTFCLHGGDFVTHGDRESSWDDEYFNRTFRNAQAFLSTVPVMGCCGNHEENGELFRKYLPYSYIEKNHNYYSFDYGPVHVAVLDQYSADLSRGSKQHTWLEQDLSDTMKHWKIVVLHEPLWTASNLSKEEEEFTHRKDLQSLFEQKGVKVVLQAHKHYYARSIVKGINYLTIAGGGAPLNRNPNYKATDLVTAEKVYHFARFDISGNDIKVSVISNDGKTVDSFSINS